MAAVAVALGVVHRRTFGWTGMVGCGVLVAGAGMAAVAAAGGEGPLAFNDGFWRAQFAIMGGSLLVATGTARSGVVSGPVAVVAFVTSWAFLGAWGVGLAWMSWALRFRRR